MKKQVEEPDESDKLQDRAKPHGNIPHCVVALLWNQFLSFPLKVDLLTMDYVELVWQRTRAQFLLSLSWEHRLKEWSWANQQTIKLVTGWWLLNVQLVHFVKSDCTIYICFQLLDLIEFVSTGRQHIHLFQSATQFCEPLRTNMECILFIFSNKIFANCSIYFWLITWILIKRFTKHLKIS